MLGGSALAAEPSDPCMTEPVEPAEPSCNMRPLHLLCFCYTLPVLQTLGPSRLSKVFSWCNMVQTLGLSLAYRWPKELSEAVAWYLVNPSAFNYTMLDNLLTYVGKALSRVIVLTPVHFSKFQECERRLMFNSCSRCLSRGLEAVMCITKEFDATRANVVCSGRKA